MLTIIAQIAVGFFLISAMILGCCVIGWRIVYDYFGCRKHPVQKAAIVSLVGMYLMCAAAMAIL